MIQQLLEKLQYDIDVQNKLIAMEKEINLLKADLKDEKEKSSKEQDWVELLRKCQDVERENILLKTELKTLRKTP